MKQNAIVVPEGCHEVLLHACCAPCSSAIVEWLLNNGVRPTIFYYNPNIWPREEYEIRKLESKRHAGRLGINWIDADYNHQQWLDEVEGLEGEPERGHRCEKCFTIRLKATANKAAELGIKYFATTLASSRWKSLEQIEYAGHQAEQTVEGVAFWAQNWRKGGLQERRNQLLKEYGFYNQQYCGCEFSAKAVQCSTKAMLRHQMREIKKQHQDQFAKMSEEAIIKLQLILDKRNAPQTILAYWPLPDEVDIRQLIDRLVKQGNTVLLPKVIDDEQMELRRFTSTADLEEGPFHILEPVGMPFPDLERVDVALIPGMAFDAAGHRLGRGKGYYDRFLSNLPNIYKIGVCFPFQRVAEVPVEEHDSSVDIVV